VTKSDQIAVSNAVETNLGFLCHLTLLQRWEILFAQEHITVVYVLFLQSFWQNQTFGSFYLDSTPDNIRCSESPYIHSMPISYLHLSFETFQMFEAKSI